MACGAPRFLPGPRQRRFCCQASPGVRAFSATLLKTPTPLGESQGLSQTPPAAEGQRAVPGRELQKEVGAVCWCPGLAPGPGAAPLRGGDPPRPVSAARNPALSSVGAGVHPSTRRMS